MVEKQEWVCPIHAEKQSNDAYYTPYPDVIVVPNKSQFKKGLDQDSIYKDGMAYYATMLHEMAHSTGSPTRLNRSMSGKFGNPTYAKEELVAELTAAMVGNSMGFDKRILDNNAIYLDNWIGVLRKEPKFIVSVMADVNKAASMILAEVDKQKVKLDKEKFVQEGSVINDSKGNQFADVSVFKMRNGEYAIRASFKGTQLVPKVVSKEEKKAYFSLSNSEDKKQQLERMLLKHYKVEINGIGETKGKSRHL